jgi:hypothetical protein
MAKLHELASSVGDVTDYDGVIFVMTKGEHLANLSFAGRSPANENNQQFIFKKLQEASYAVAFLGQHAEQKASPPVSD